MKKVSILIPSLKKGGAEKQACLLARALRDEYEINMIIMSPEAGLEKENIQLSGLPSECIQTLNGDIFHRVKFLYQVLKKNTPDFLFCYLTRPDFFGPIIGRLTGVKYIFQGLRNARVPMAKMILEQLGNMFSTGAIINNYSGKKYFKRYGIRTQVVIPNCYFTPQVWKERQEKNIITVVTVGRFVEQKDYPTAIAAMAQAMQYDSRLRYKIIGHGELETEVRKLVRHYHIENKTEILINPKGIMNHLVEADIYLSTSLFEGTSNSIMEALDASLPIVATNVGDNDRLINDNINGFLVQCGNIDKISERIVSLSSSLKMRNEFGLAGNRLLRDNYSFDSFKHRYFSLMNTVESNK